MVVPATAAAITRTTAPMTHLSQRRRRGGSEPAREGPGCTIGSIVLKSGLCPSAPGPRREPASSPAPIPACHRTRALPPPPAILGPNAALLEQDSAPRGG